VMASVHPRHAGVASAATNTSRELGGVFGIALLGAVVTSAFTRTFLSNLILEGFPRQVAGRIAQAGGANAAAGGGSGAGAIRSIQRAGFSHPQAVAILDAVHRSFVHAIHVGMLFSVAFMVLASVLSFLFVRSHVGAGAEERVAEGAMGV
jgi:hypothetical protein